MLPKKKKLLLLLGENQFPFRGNRSLNAPSVDSGRSHMNDLEEGRVREIIKRIDRLVHYAHFTVA
jgi:hypothetical protein